MTDDGLEQARDRLREKMGKGARFDAPSAPHEALSAMRLARAACTRRITSIDDRGLEQPLTAALVAEVSCLARYLAEGLEQLTGHIGLEGGDAERSSDLAGEVTLAKILPGRALRALYLHALQHLDVALRDLDDAGWQKSLEVPGLAVGTPASAVSLMNAALQRCSKELH